MQENSHQRYKHWFNKQSKQGPVLIVFDNIHDEAQFDELILRTNLFAPRSCIIVTSHDQYLLNIVAPRDLNDYLYDVIPLECHDFYTLFNWHVFGKEEAFEAFKALASDVSNACGDLPLALKVISSSFVDKTLDEDIECIWREAIDA